MVEEQSSKDIDSDPLHILVTTEVVVKKDTSEHQVYIHVHSTQDKIAFHLDHVMQDLGKWPSQVIVDEENC